MENTFKITNINELIKAVEIAKENFSGQVWWRGQRDLGWNLIPSVFRNDNAKSEKSRLFRFRQKAPSRYQNVPPINELHNWLFLMQHHNLPTRLLDWTESPLIACFFAVDVNPSSIEYPQKIKDSDGILYALSPYRLNQLQINKKKLMMPDSEEAMEIVRCAFGENTTDVERFIAIRPSEVHVRLMTQLSVFTLHGSNKLLIELPKCDEFLMQFQIPKKSKKDLQEELKHLGIRLSNIFPDLDNLAKDIRSSKFNEDELSDNTSVTDVIDTSPLSSPHFNKYGSYGQIQVGGEGDT